MPVYESLDLMEELTKRNSIMSIESTFSIDFKRDGNSIKGDAVLRLTRDAFDLQVYSSGFLVADINSVNNVTRSSPDMDRNRLLMLIDGIRHSFFWWSIKNYEVKDMHDKYIVYNSWKKLFIDKNTITPEKQIVELEDGRQLEVFYGNPVMFDDTWFPSEMRIELSGRSVKLKIEAVSTNLDDAIKHGGQ